MLKRLALAMCAIAPLAACNMRVSGVVIDRDSGQPIGACTVSAGTQYTHTDPTGRYALKTKWKAQQSLQFVAPGYAIQSKTLDARGNRYPVQDVEMVRLRASSAPPGARFDPYTGEPLKYEVPRFDPYTGKPLDPVAR